MCGNPNMRSRAQWKAFLPSIGLERDNCLKRDKELKRHNRLDGTTAWHFPQRQLEGAFTLPT